MIDHESFAVNSEVRWPLDTTTVYGTIVRPSGPGPFPAAVLVAGSGPTDRDWNTPLLPGTNGSARLLATALAEAGFASLRYDKRASGPHAHENMRTLIGKISMQSHLDELTGAVHTLAGQEFVRADQIFAVANSEGTLHALNYQIQRPVLPFTGLVLIAPPGRPVGAVARAQLAAQGVGAPNREAMLALYDAAIARFQAGESLAPDPALPEGVRTLLQALATPANLPFARELWLADAATLLGQVAVPVLVIIGKKDLQVDWQADGELLQCAAAGCEDVTFLFPEDANHVLKHEAKPRSSLVIAEVMQGYNGPDARLDPDGLARLVAWLAAHA